MRFLSLSWRLSDEHEVEVMEAEEDEGDDIVESVDEVEEVDDLCKSIGDGFSSTCSTPFV